LSETLSEVVNVNEREILKGISIWRSALVSKSVLAEGFPNCLLMTFLDFGLGCKRLFWGCCGICIFQVLDRIS